MNCSRCNNPATPGAAFCGSCGQPLGHAAHPSAAAQTTPQPATPSSAEPAVPTPIAPPQTAADPRLNHQAIAAIVFGVLGCAGWLIPIFGVILGILAVVFGTIGLKSQKRKLAIVGIVLAIPVIAISLYVWIEAAKQLMDEQSGKTGTYSSNESAMQTITTPCFSTRLPDTLTVSQSNDCDFKATNNTSGELYQVKVMDIPDLATNNLPTAAKADANNVVSLVSSATLDGEWEGSFVGSPAYTFTLHATDGSAGTIKYVYHISSGGNVVIVFHSQANGTSYDLGTIENNWYWR